MNIQRTFCLCLCLLGNSAAVCNLLVSCQPTWYQHIDSWLILPSRKVWLLSWVIESLIRLTHDKQKFWFEFCNFAASILFGLLFWAWIISKYTVKTKTVTNICLKEKFIIQLTFNQKQISKANRAFSIAQKLHMNNYLISYHKLHTILYFFRVIFKYIHKLN